MICAPIAAVCALQFRARMRNTAALAAIAIALAACAAQGALGSVVRSTQDIFVPQVLDPHAGTVWNKDETRTVVWWVSSSCPQHM